MPIYLPIRFGDFLEQTLGRQVKKHMEVPLAPEKLTDHAWYRIMLEKGMSGDGSLYHIYIRGADPNKLLLFFSGGGVAWNAYTAARPVTGGKMAAGLPNYYWSNLRPVTQMMNIHTGITKTTDRRNPFSDWSMLIITYATGDFHIGNSDFPYLSEDGHGEVLHFHGYRNFHEAMEKAKQYFPDVDSLLIAGDSAGGFAVPALTPEILQQYYPEVHDVTVFSDSSQLLYKKWRYTARTIWGAEEEIWKCLKSGSPLIDWYKRLYGIYADRLRYLYAGSTHDFLLSAYQNDLDHKRYETNAKVQQAYFRRFRKSVLMLQKAVPSMHFYLYSRKNYRLGLGGTVHTAVRRNYFFSKGQNEISMADWLSLACSGDEKNIGMDLLNTARE